MGHTPFGTQKVLAHIDRVTLAAEQIRDPLYRKPFLARLATLRRQVVQMTTTRTIDRFEESGLDPITAVKAKMEPGKNDPVDFTKRLLDAGWLSNPVSLDNGRTFRWNIHCGDATPFRP